MIVKKNRSNHDNVKELVQWLKKNEIDFEASLSSFNGGCVKFKINSENQKINFSEKITKKYLGLAGSIKADLRKKIKINEINTLLKYLHVNNCYIYKEKNILTGYEYDLNNAYYSVLIYLYPELTEKINKIIELKKINKNVYQKILGIILLGNKINTVVKNGKIVESTYKVNELQPIYYLCRYLIVKTFEKMLMKEFYNSRLSYFIDACQLSRNVSVTLMSFYFETYFYDVFFELNKKILKYENKDIFYFYGISENIFDKIYNNNIFSFKQKLINNIVYLNELGIKKMIFTRDNKVITYKLSM